MKQVHVLFLLLLLTGLQVTTTVKAEKRPNIVWITSEDNSKHYMKLFDEHGVAAPNIESLAKTGIVFDKAFSNAAVCSAARSTLISSCYGPRLATHYHRNIEKVTMPEGSFMFPKYLRDAGYYTTNNAKEDYNIVKTDNVWDMSSKKATWRDRKDGQPFFHVFNIATTHESRLHFTKEQMEAYTPKVNPDDCFVQPNHPNTDLFHYTNAYYRDKIVQMDGQVGAVVKQLEKDGLLDDTFIFYYGDHGGVLPGSKGYIYETGVHVPLVVYVPKNYKHLANNNSGVRSDRFVSFVDFGTTVLSLAGIEIPKQMDGKPFMGAKIDPLDEKACQSTFSYADRFDEKYEMIRAVRKGKYKYIRNYQPYLFDGLMNNYRYKQLAFQEWSDLNDADKLNDIQAAFYREKPAEMLFDVEDDPFETKNLANDPNLKSELKSMRKELSGYMNDMPDLSFYPEYYLIENAFTNTDKFGNEHKSDILALKKISDLALLPYEKAESKIIKALQSDDTWKRFWGLQVALAKREKSVGLKSIVKNIEKNDEEILNRVMARSFLCMQGDKVNEDAFLTDLYKTKTSAEGLQVINTLVFLQDSKLTKPFSVDSSKMLTEIAENKEVYQRLLYLEKELVAQKK